MRNRHIIVLTLVCFVFSVSYTSGQNNNFVTYGLEEGLIQSQIRTITQDNSGVLWIGTIGGLAKYDGTGFTNYTQKDGLAEDWVTAALMDTLGNIWFGHWGGGVTKYDFKKNILINLEFYEHSNDKLISSIAYDASGYLWFGTDGFGIIKYNPENQQVEHFKEESSGEGISSNNISSLHVDQHNRIWAGSDKGVTILNSGTGNSRAEINILNKLTGLFSDKIRCISQINNNELWLGTEDAGIIRLYLADDNLIRMFGDIKIQNPDIIQSITIANGLTSNNIKTLYQDDENKVWIGTQSNGIIQFIPDSINKLTASLSDGELNLFSNKFEIKYYHAYVFSQDREGNIWIGTDIGLNKYMGDLFKIYNHNEGLINDLVWSVLEDSKGNMWFGTTDGASRFSFPEENGIVQYNNPTVKNYTVRDGIAENIIISMHEDANGNIWMGSENSGVSVLLKSGDVRTYSIKDGIADNKIFTINSDNDGYIWLGTRKGASKIDLQNARVQNYNTTNGLGGDKVFNIFKDSKGILWFAILGGDLTSYNGTSFKTYGKDQGLSQQFIISITEDKENNMWFGAYQGGIIKYDGKEFISLGVDEGLSSNSPNFIICDDDNNIWMGMSLSIEKYDQITQRFISYGKQQGFLGMETNENAAFKDKHGNIWFGTVKGAVKFDPKKEKPNFIESLTFTKGLNIYLKETEFPEDGKFNYDQNHLTFHNIGISLTNPREVRYRYKLEGFDENWSPPTKDRQKSYSNLPPGKYVFKVISSNNNGVWNEAPTEYGFIVTPPFWQTWWFYTLCVIFTVSAIIVYIRIRERNLIRQQKILEHQVKIRTAQLNEKKEEVEKQNKNIRASINYAKRIQQSILVKEEEIRQHLPGTFIFYQPRDIVSGDFYWYTHINGKSIIAAVDCTGHGVPGAFMSMIGNTLLNQIVNEKQVTDAAEILGQMHLGVLKSLHQGKKDAQSQDGMDMSLCVISTNGNSGEKDAEIEIQFAGALNPLYVIQNNKVEVISPNVFAIGGRQLKKEKGKKREFTNHNLKLKNGSGIYLFSDGYIDQFGGENDVKFSPVRFKQMLIDNYQSEAESQKTALNETMKQWLGDRKQIDDILVVGIKF